MHFNILTFERSPIIIKSQGEGRGAEPTGGSSQVERIRLLRQSPTTASRSPPLRYTNVQATYAQALEALGWKDGAN